MEHDSTVQHVWRDKALLNLAVKTARAENSALGFVWLGGFKSDMAGTKAEVMVDEAAAQGCDSLRFDYSGHGESGGEFVDGTISRWVDESLKVVLEKTIGPQILVGSSMGGWIALRLAHELANRAESDRLAGLLLIAPAPDFTAELMEPAFTEAQRNEMAEQGYIEEPSEYSDEPNIITRDLIEDGRNNLVLDKNIALGIPTHILQGMKDPDVPYQHALKLADTFVHDDVTMTLIKGGDHRLSRDEDLETLRRTMGLLKAKCHF